MGEYNSPRTHGLRARRTASWFRHQAYEIVCVANLTLSSYIKCTLKSLRISLLDGAKNDERQKNRREMRCAGKCFFPSYTPLPHPLRSPFPSPTKHPSSFLSCLFVFVFYLLRFSCSSHLTERIKQTDTVQLQTIV